MLTKPALILLICLMPVALSSGLYFSGAVSGGNSYGQLLSTQPFPAAAAAGWPKAQWALVSLDNGPCDASCRQRLFALQQIQIGQGENRDRIARVRVRQDGVHEPLAGVVSLSQPKPAVTMPSNGYYLVDPLGNQVLFYPDSADPIRVMRELAKVIKTNNGL